jgi:thiol-disulfide isomerase/thioredoxin
MKKAILSFVLIIFSVILYAQDHFETIIENSNSIILKGLITRDDIVKKSAADWFATNQQGYTPNTTALEALKRHGSSIHIIAFIGTWCVDTRFILPKFYSITEAASFPAGNLTVIGVDRNKKTLNNLSEALNVTNVPTFIVLKDGKELGRVVEYGKYGMWDKELGDVINLAGTTASK